MHRVTQIAQVREAVRAARAAGQRIGFVPTMGYLHEGHLALMRKAKEECGFVVASIFVNPTQFGPNEDLARYPRDFARDQALCASVPIDLLFHPDVEEIYPQPFRTSVRVSGLTDRLCGASRPGHFAGVATVVTKLFHIVQPDAAYFGQKDAQQVAVIQRLVADLNLDLAIVPVPTVREPDGLALSSRNSYLSPAERQAAPVLYRALQSAQHLVQTGERSIAILTQAMRTQIAAEPLAEIDYIEIVDAQTLQPIERLEAKALAALAVRFGKTRLIDNALLEP